MTRNRFQKVLQFADNSNYDATYPSRDKLFKVRDIVEFLVYCFKTVYIASGKISIDKQPLLYKGRLSLNNIFQAKDQDLV